MKQKSSSKIKECLTNYSQYCGLSIVFLTCIRKVAVSHSYRTPPILTDAFRDFTQSFKGIAVTVS